MHMFMCVESQHLKKIYRYIFLYIFIYFINFLQFSLWFKKDAVASFQGCRRMNNLLLLHSAVTWSHSVSTAQGDALVKKKVSAVAFVFWLGCLHSPGVSEKSTTGLSFENGFFGRRHWSLEKMLRGRLTAAASMGQLEVELQRLFEISSFPRNSVCVFLFCVLHPFSHLRYNGRKMAMGAAVQDPTLSSSYSHYAVALCRRHHVQPCVSGSAGISGPVAVEATGWPTRSGSVPLWPAQRSFGQPPAFRLPVLYLALSPSQGALALCNLSRYPSQLFLSVRSCDSVSRWLGAGHRGLLDHVESCHPEMPPTHHMDVHGVSRLCFNRGSLWLWLSVVVVASYTVWHLRRAQQARCAPSETQH